MMRLRLLVTGNSISHGQSTSRVGSKQCMIGSWRDERVEYNQSKCLPASPAVESMPKSRSLGHCVVCESEKKKRATDVRSGAAVADVTAADPPRLEIAPHVIDFFGTQVSPPFSPHKSSCGSIPLLPTVFAKPGGEAHLEISA